MLPRFVSPRAVSGGGKFTENEQMKISSYNPASSKYNIQDNTKNWNQKLIQYISRVIYVMEVVAIFVLTVNFLTDFFCFLFLKPEQVRFIYLGSICFGGEWGSARASAYPEALTV